MTDIDPDDVKAMRKEGSLRDFLRMQIAEGQARKQPAKPAPPTPHPGHVPGAWPTGSRPPSRIAATPPGAWAAALERDRDGTQAGTTCECPGCLTPSQEGPTP
ncbi:hypothetical protein ACFXD5_12105 [Streptomyces sp. NPDC059385]|uniref:hypothetical protein n=1 Tax=Streptomyces sp. NPDC059385 TaxID=3346817 RepID=UPI003699F07A